MDGMNDFLRAMFGLGSQRPPGGNHRPEEGAFIFFDTDNEDDEVPWGNGQSGHLFGGNIFSHFMRDMEQMNREMANMFQSFEIGFPSEHQGNPRLPANPRDDMLKKPDSTPEESGSNRGQPDPGQGGMGPSFHQPAPFFGGFLSSQRPGFQAPVENNDSDTPQTGQHDNPWMPHTRPFITGRIVSVTTTIGPNGEVEERRTVRDLSSDDFNKRLDNKNEQTDFSAPSEPNSLLKSPPQFPPQQTCPPQPQDSDKDKMVTTRLKRLFDWVKFKYSDKTHPD